MLWIVRLVGQPANAAKRCFVVKAGPASHGVRGGTGRRLRSELEPYLSAETTRGVDAHFRAASNAHRRSRPSAGAGTCFGLTAPFARGARAGLAVTLATHQSKGLVRVRGRVSLRTRRRRTLRVASGQKSFPEGVEGRFEAVEDPSADRLAGRLCGIADRSRDGTRPSSPFRLPARDCWFGSDPTGGWDGHAHPSRPRAV